MIESSSPEKPESPPAESARVSVVIFKFTETDPIAVAFQKLLDNLQGPPVTLAVGTGNLTSLPVGFRFTDHLMTGKGATTFDHQFIMSCTCPHGTAECQNSSKCPCKIKAGNFTTSNPEILKEGRSNALAIIECHRRCKCDIDCFGRVVQRGRKIPLEIFWAGTKGWGLRCPEKLPRGILVDKYFGEVIGPREASRRAKINDKNGASYLFTLDKFDVPRGKYHAIDGERFGGVARFINHSCSPNLTAYAVVSDRRDWKVYDVAFFTNKIINAGEELTYDYVERVVGGVDEDAEGWECLCGSEGCKGHIF
ncbi:hypothetical protein Q9L58_009755 [Maublancomyces gigas]|uniref:SET domain-containing protein n=1 Tax=Discina gigas TaxID=1032678 RepID=A0ABR3G695_9PEZI